MSKQNRGSKVRSRRRRRYVPPPRDTAYRPCARGEACDCKPGDNLCAKRAALRTTTWQRASYRDVYRPGGFNPTAPHRHRDWKNAQRATRKARKGV